MRSIQTILGHNDLEAAATENEKIVLRTGAVTSIVTNNFQEEIEANKENSKNSSIRSTTTTTTRLPRVEQQVRNQPQPHEESTFQIQQHQQQPRHGLKRTHSVASQPCSTVEIQYVTTESKLDAPGKCTFEKKTLEANHS